MDTPLVISSLQNPRVKGAVKLRQRSHRDKLGLMLIEGYREIRRALDHAHTLQDLFFCPELFMGENNQAVLDDARRGGARLDECTRQVFDKLSYRDRPDGLLAVAAQVHHNLDELVLPANPLVVVAEAIEKPGNLGTILRSADGAGVHAVIVCDRCTDINNPNVVRSSVGTLFTLPVVEASSEATLAWLRTRGIRIVATTPHTQQLYSDVDLAAPTAIVVGTEQYGLSHAWLAQADIEVRIPMLGTADSLNVASATTILLYEALRQRGSGHVRGAGAQQPQG
jgi:TrmH family RNA methyltransferase